jgi:hypothetical protein
MTSPSPIAVRAGGQAERQLPLAGEEMTRVSHDGGEIRH